MKKFLVSACAVGALVFGSVAIAAPGGFGGGLGGGGLGGGLGGGDGDVDPACAAVCPLTIDLPGDSFCVLDGCFVVGDAAFCNYRCFYALPF